MTRRSRCTAVGISVVLALSPLVYRYLTQPPRLTLHIETVPPGCQVWVSGTLKGRAPLAMELSEDILGRGSFDVTSFSCEVNTTIGRENAVELLFRSGQQKHGPLRIEAGRSEQKELVDWIGATPMIERVGYHRYLIRLAIRVGSHSSLPGLDPMLP